MQPFKSFVLLQVVDKLSKARGNLRLKSEERRRGIEEIRELLSRRAVNRPDVDRLPVLAASLGRSFEQALKRPEIALEDLAVVEEALAACAPALRRHAELDVKYEGYVRRQRASAERFLHNEGHRIPQDIDYDGVTGLSNESREKLKRVRPRSLGQAGRISGIRPSDLAILAIHTSRRA